MERGNESRCLAKEASLLLNIIFNQWRKRTFSPNLGKIVYLLRNPPESNRRRQECLLISSGHWPKRGCILQLFVVTHFPALFLHVLLGMLFYWEIVWILDIQTPANTHTHKYTQRLEKDFRLHRKRKGQSSRMGDNHRNPRSYARRSMFEKGRFFFIWSPPYFVKWREVLYVAWKNVPLK
jgi:hypothetical protein